MNILLFILAVIILTAINYGGGILSFMVLLNQDRSKFEKVMTVIIGMTLIIFTLFLFENIYKEIFLASVPIYLFAIEAFITSVPLAIIILGCTIAFEVDTESMDKTASQDEEIVIDHQSREWLSNLHETITTNKADTLI